MKSNLSPLLLTLFLAPTCCLQAAVIWDNGPLVTHPAGMVNGSDRSAVSPTGNLLGALANIATGFRVADDFTISSPSEQLGVIRFYAYQTGSTSTSTFTGATLQILNGMPGSGASVIYGDATTNVLSATGFTNIYRTAPTDNISTNRPIMFIDIDLGGFNLTAGTYWLDWGLQGTLGSGPWAPPVSDPITFPVGNALQLNAGNWANLLDSAANVQVALPFIINSQSQSIVPEPSTLTLLLGGLCLLMRRRR